MLETGPQKLGRQQHRHQSPQAERALSNSVLDSAFLKIALWVLWSKLCFGFFAPSCACYLWIEFIENKVYRPWRDEMMKIGVGLSGGLLEDATANHFFMSMQAKGTVQESFNVSLMQLMQT